MTRKVVLITGGSSGIGQALACTLRDRGYAVYEGSRRDSTVEGITHLSLDVTDSASVEAAVRTIVDREGRIDILVTAAGSGISGAIEFTDEAAARRQMEVNFLGTDCVVRAVLPVMRQAGGGRMLLISSVASAFPIPFQSYYSASKAAIDAYACALANEVRPFGVCVTAVRPGDIRTGFTAARKKSFTGDDIYDGRIARSVAVMEHDEEHGIDPAVAGRQLAALAAKPTGPIVTLGLSYRALCFLKRLLPYALVNRLIGAIYAK